jgi:hypothetical protein
MNHQEEIHMKTTPKVLASIILVLAGITVNAQTHSSAPLVHPIPTAPKKSYSPASFSAMPGLQCKLYPGGRAASKGLTVFTDDDGYARFHAVRATASDAIQRLALDCTDSAGKSYSYFVDLTSDETFAPRPLNLANERGTDRPALTGDPLSYSQSELIQAGYGLRPDPTDTAAYVRWLASASAPGRMLEAKRSSSTAHTSVPVRSNTTVHPNTVNKTTAPWWVGSTLNGDRSYAAIEANFNVPTATPGGDETSSTQVAVWTGVEGAGNNSGLIQGGVGIYTDGPAAGYYTWREYCCGDGDSNGYGGAFTPKPGENIYAQNWYCDATGNISLTGGYGCTYLHDLTSGAILNCTLPAGKPCWSVKALANWTSEGTDADFVIENQTPQLYSPWNATTAYTKGQVAVYGTYPYLCLKANTDQQPNTHAAYWELYQRDMAFTDFAPQVNMAGSAYSTATGKYSQTVTSDSAVDLLEDFTNATSHMNVTLGTTDETYFSVSQFKQVGGLASNSATAEPIAVGPNANGSQVGDAWTLGFNPDVNGQYAIYQWKNSNWVEQPGRATHIAVGPEGYPWAVNYQGLIYYWDGNSFEPAPNQSTTCASWISVGPNAYGSSYGDPWILGCHEGTDGYSVYQLQGSNWVYQNAKAVKIAVGPKGPWITSITGAVYYWNGSGFVEAPTACATSIAVGPLSAPFAGPYGDVWTTGCHLDGNGYRIYQLQKGTTWVEIPGIASAIAVSPDFGVPWYVDTVGHIFE